MIRAENLLKGGIIKMNKKVQMVKFNGRKQHIIAGNFAMISNIFAVPPRGDV